VTEKISKIAGVGNAKPLIYVLIQSVLLSGSQHLLLGSVFINNCLYEDHG
jgi:hypothetical protein